MDSVRTFTPAQFAEKHKIARTTVWRWLNNKKLALRFKMYDAKPIEIAGKTFIQQSKQKVS